MSKTCRLLYQINLRNSASRWFLLYEYNTMHGPLNVKQHLQFLRYTLVLAGKYSCYSFELG